MYTRVTSIMHALSTCTPSNTHTLTLASHALPHPLYTTALSSLRITNTTKPAFPVSSSSFSILLLRFSHDSVVKSKKRKNGFASTTESRSSASVSPHPQLYTVGSFLPPGDNKSSFSTPHQNSAITARAPSIVRQSIARQRRITALGARQRRITALPHDDNDDDDDATPQSCSGETKSAESSPLWRRGGIATLATPSSLHLFTATNNSIAAVSNIVNMILAPMVIVPFFDYLEHGKIPRSSTAKPGSADGPTAKMGSLNSISQPLAKGWTVIFVSVR